MAQHHETKQNLLQFMDKKSQNIIVLSCFIILIVTLLPFDFTYPENFSWDDLKTILTTVSSPGDILVNLALFIPFGWGVTTFLSTRKVSLLKNILLTLVISFCLSSTVEILQIFLLLRRTTPTDVLNNSLSGCLGGVLFLLARNRLNKIYFDFDRRLFLNFSVIIWLIYLITIGISLISLKDATKLSNWDVQYPLMIGNERTENRPWQGKISYLYLSDRFLHEPIIKKIFTNNNQSENFRNNLFAAYIFDKKNSIYSDQLGNWPSLIWKREQQNTIETSAITLDKNNWLQTTIPPNQLTQRIQNNSQFTIITKIQNKNKYQPGEGRIFSLSQNIYQRNISLEQSKNNLKLRLRTVLTGDNGSKPTLIWRNFFKDNKFHQIAIAYNGKELKFYLDSIDNVYNLKFNSEAALFWSVFHTLGSTTPLYINKSSLYNFLYYDLLFIPFGFLLALILVFLPKDRRFYRLILCLGIIVPSLFIESIIVITDNGTLSWYDLMVGVIIIAITSIVFKTLMTFKFPFPIRK